MAGRAKGTVVGYARGYHHNSDYKYDCIKTAKELCYNEDVIKMIQEAESDAEVSRIMTNARKGLIK